MKKIINIFLFFVIFSLMFASSSFAPFGFPENSYGTDIFSLGMGSTAIGDLFRINSSFINPSLVMTANNVKMSTAYIKKRVEFDGDEFARRIDLKSYEFPYFNFTYPFLTNAVAFNFNSYLLSNFESEESDFTQEYNSNIFRAGLIYGKRFPFFNIGLGAYQYLGSVEFSEIEANNQGGNTTTYTEFSDNRFGYNIGISQKILNFSYGLFYNSKVEMDGFSNLSTTEESDPTDSTTTDTSYSESTSYSLKLPDQAGFGMAYRFDSRFIFAFDLLYEIWKDSDFIDNTSNTIKYSFGTSYTPSKGNNPWYLSIPLRFGYYYKNLPFEANSNSVIEQGTSFGLSFPSKNKNNRLDFSLTLLFRGNKAANLREDRAIYFGVGIMGFDVFSKKRTRKESRDIPKADMIYEDF